MEDVLLPAVGDIFFLTPNRTSPVEGWDWGLLLVSAGRVRDGCVRSHESIWTEGWITAYPGYWEPIQATDVYVAGYTEQPHLKHQERGSARIVPPDDRDSGQSPLNPDGRVPWTVVACARPLGSARGDRDARHWGGCGVTRSRMGGQPSLDLLGATLACLRHGRHISEGLGAAIKVFCRSRTHRSPSFASILDQLSVGPFLEGSAARTTCKGRLHKCFAEEAFEWCAPEALPRQPLYPGRSLEFSRLASLGGAAGPPGPRVAPLHYRPVSPPGGGPFEDRAPVLRALGGHHGAGWDVASLRETVRALEAAYHGELVPGGAVDGGP
jgi:hypothetical protein